MKAGIVLALAGIWIGAQVLAGGALDKIFNASTTSATSSTSSTSGAPVAATPVSSGVAAATIPAVTALGGMF